jgi:septation ring formation regulator EzrA
MQEVLAAVSRARRRPGALKEQRMPDIQVYYDQLPKYARYWDENASTVGQISEESRTLEYRNVPGIFSGFVGAYNQACEEVSQVCGQGCVQMQRIAQALMSAYNGYVKTEAENYQLSRTVVSELREP